MDGWLLFLLCGRGLANTLARHWDRSCVCRAGWLHAPLASPLAQPIHVALPGLVLAPPVLIGGLPPLAAVPGP